MNDRRRVNGPSGGTYPALFIATESLPSSGDSYHPNQQRGFNDARRKYLKTGLIPSASGSAYLELESSKDRDSESIVPQQSLLKLTCSVHGPRPLPRSASFSPHMHVSTTVKFAPFATSQRQGYLRDHTERDLAAQLETAIRGVILTEKWPKSCLEVVVTVIEGEGKSTWDNDLNPGVTSASTQSLYGLMSVFSGCVTVASAAIADAGIDSVDIVAGGSAAILRSLPEVKPEGKTAGQESFVSVVLDPEPEQYKGILAACSVAYLQSRAEIISLWMKGHIPEGTQASGVLIQGAVKAATASALVIKETLRSH